MAEVVGRELRLPARPDARLRAGHDRRVVDQDVDAAPGVEEALGEGVDAVEVAEVELVDLDALDAGEHLARVLGPAGRDDDVRAGAGERARGLQAEARVAAGDDREPAGEVDAGEDLGGGAAVAEARVDRMLGSRHDPSLSLRARSKSSASASQAREHPARQRDRRPRAGGRRSERGRLEPGQQPAQLLPLGGAHREAVHDELAQAPPLTAVEAAQVPPCEQQRLGDREEPEERDRAHHAEHRNGLPGPPAS